MRLAPDPVPPTPSEPAQPSIPPEEPNPAFRPEVDPGGAPIEQPTFDPPANPGDWRPHDQGAADLRRF